MASAAFFLEALSVRERYAGLLYGSLAGDAFGLPAHDSGAQTLYGAQALVLMESLETCGGNFVMDDFARRWRRFAEEPDARHDSATRETLAHLREGLGLTRAGSNSTEIGGASRIAPLLVALRNEDEPVILGAARAQTALTHAAPAVLDAAELIARTVFILMRGVSLPNALAMAVANSYRTLRAERYLKQAQEARDLPTREAVAKIGSSADLESALPAVFLILLRHGHELDTAFGENVLAGGDVAARGMILGTLLGAAHGRRAIPERWMLSLRARSQIDAFLQTAGLGEE